MTMSDVHIPLDTTTIDCTAEEIAGVFAGLLREMRAAAPFLQDDDRIALRQVMEHEPGTLTVSEVFPGSKRGSRAHTSLRRLRTAQFIRPAGRDMWDAESRIDIKPFARLAWERLGESGIFGDASETVADPDGEEIDLALPEVNDPAKPDTIRTQRAGAAAWQDDDVLDYLKDETKG
jgi:hypothetical protein